MGSERVSRESEIRARSDSVTERVDREPEFSDEWELPHIHLCRLDRHSLLCDVTTLLAEVVRLRTALSYYALEERYEADDASTLVEMAMDRGWTARAALGEDE